jgi:hypothetical protein
MVLRLYFPYWAGFLLELGCNWEKAKGKSFLMLVLGRKLVEKKCL